jgi:uncharacterized glyoxalase superfamily protein PhnB
MTQTITPYLLYEDGEAAADFVARAFGFREVERTIGEAGGLHVELEGPAGGHIYLGAPPSGFENPAKVGRTCLMYVIVGDLDVHYEQAKAAGAEIVEEPRDTDVGHRRYGCRDPQGHEWFFAQVVEN